MTIRTAIGIWGAIGAVSIATAQPVIVVQPQNQAILENGPSTFSVEAAGAGPVRYQWLRHTNFAHHSAMDGETSPVLHFPSTPYTYHGFAVVVSDDTGAVTSRIARLTYKLRFFQYPVSQVTTQGLTADITALGIGSVPFTYQWYFRDLPLPNETAERLVLHQASPEDNGPYSVVLLSGLGSVTSQVASLTVLPGTNPPPSRPSFVNFETAPVHPVALNPDRSRLAVCNLPDARLELFDASAGHPRALGSVPVGLDPVSARFRTSNEVWVVNHISDSVNVVSTDTMRVTATLQTLDGPADVVFAGDPPRAFVSCAMENAVLVFDVLTRQRIATLPIDGERPKAMCVSRDGREAYVAIFESGNASTILAPLFGTKGQLAVHSTLGHTNGPYGGQNPPPNQGTNFNPAIRASIPPSIPIPRDGHIVKKNAAGRWMDDNNGDWTEFVSGSRAELSGRVVGWDLPDRDVAIIDVESLQVRYANGLMNLCMAIAVNPGTDEVTVVGTDGLNEVRFEPNLKGTFLRVNLARYNPETQEKIVTDLNPHLDYATRTIPLSERRKSIGDPRDIVWNAAGTIAYISGMGSGNLIAVDTAGGRLGTPLELESGACGMALDEARDRLFVLNRFANTISTIDLEDWEVLSRMSMFDPTPPVIKAGRPHLYNTHKNSGLGYVSCASCHPDGRMDRLAWDLGDPAGPVVTVNFNFHPMKGPMVTLTLQDIIGHEGFHWRGDRLGIEQFNQTFSDLLAGPLLTTNEMREFKDFLATITLPPNRHRNLDNSLSTNVPLAGHVASGRRQLPAGAPLPNGNARLGLDAFNGQLGCAGCHRLPTGLGPPVLLGPNLERLVGFGVLGRNSLLPFKIVQLRNLHEKGGMDLRNASGRAGFGFSFNGRVDTLARFMDLGFPTVNDQMTANMVALLLSFSGSDLSTNNVFPLGLPSRDVPAGVGKAVIFDGFEPLDQVLQLALQRNARTELVIRSRTRSWLYNRATNLCQSDRSSEVLSLQDLSALATPDDPLTFMIVPRGTGFRMALDRDGDGHFDRDELDANSDPGNPDSIPLLARIARSSNIVALSWPSQPGRLYRIQFSDDLSSNWTDLGETIIATGTNTTTLQALDVPRRFYRIRAVP